jgi:hypothetical protein
MTPGRGRAAARSRAGAIALALAALATVAATFARDSGRGDEAVGRDRDETIAGGSPGALRPPARATPASTLGTFAPSPDQLVDYSEWIGHEVRSGLAYASWKGDWARWQRSITAVVEDYVDDRWPFEPRLVLSVPMLVREPLDASDPTTLAAGAAGRYDAYWEWLGRFLADTYGRSLGDRFVMRLGHESNIRFYQWSAHPDSHSGETAPADFAAYWRRIHGIVDPIAASAGADVVWDWNVATAGDAATAVRSYPGDEYVDVVSVDFYDRTGDPDDVLTRLPLSLDGWLVPFADAHGKPIAIDEWGVFARDGRGGGDNPEFVEAVHAWIDAQLRAGRLLWHHQFDKDDEGADTYHRLREDGRYDFPRARERFLELFGG